MNVEKMNPVKIPCAVVFCLGLVFAVTGCNTHVYDKQYFFLDADRAGRGVVEYEDSGAILEVRRFTIDRAFDARSLVYRKDKYEYESDFYNEFLISPAEMISEKARLWLSNSGMFTMVSGLNGSIMPTHTLVGNITALYGDYTNRSAPQAVMEIRIFLIENDAEQNQVAFGKTYNTSVGVESDGPEGLIEAFDSGLETILSQLESDLAGKI